MIKGFFSILLAAILFVIIITVTLIGSAWLGYWFGHLLEWGAGDILTGVFGIKSEQIPMITAWLFVLAGLIGKLSSKTDD